MTELKYIKYPPSFGGGALSGCGTIYQSEIIPTLKKLQEDLDFPTSFEDCLTGSTGKREYSGDIDIVLDEDSGITIDILKELLMYHLGEDNIRQNGDSIHVRYKISEFNQTHVKFGPRTGFVQIDFFIGNKKWEQLFHYGCSKSEYKGAHRNLAIAAVAAIKDNNSSRGKDQFERPIQEIRWKWGSNGLIRVIRRSVKIDAIQDKYRKIQADEIIAGPYTDLDDILVSLFDKNTKQDLDSVETIMEAVKRNFNKREQDAIWKKMAQNFSNWPDGKYFQYPDEIAAFMEQD